MFDSSTEERVAILVLASFYQVEGGVIFGNWSFRVNPLDSVFIAAQDLCEAGIEELVEFRLGLCY